MSTRKRSTRPSDMDAKAPEEEGHERRKNVKSLAVLRAHEPAVQQLEELLFGDVQVTPRM